jgi:hypothetical protein
VKSAPVKSRSRPRRRSFLATGETRMIGKVFEMRAPEPTVRRPGAWRNRSWGRLPVSSLLPLERRGCAVSSHFGDKRCIPRVRTQRPDVLATDYVTEVDYSDYSKRLKVHCCSPWHFSEASFRVPL